MMRLAVFLDLQDVANEDKERSELLSPGWQAEFESATVKLDPDLLAKPVDDAESATMRRLEVIANNADHFDERSAITDALTTLRIA
jgi:hypothetical protein